MRYFDSHFVFAYILNCSTLTKFQLSVWSSAMPKETESIKKKNLIPQNKVKPQIWVWLPDYTIKAEKKLQWIYTPLHQWASHGGSIGERFGRQSWTPLICRERGEAGGGGGGPGPSRRRSAGAPHTGRSLVASRWHPIQFRRSEI